MRTSIPRRENELKGSAPSPVTTSQLTPEELEEIRRKYPATKRDKAFKKPVEIKTIPKGDNEMAKFTLTEDQFNAERAAGKSVAKIAKEQGVSEATIYNHVSKWADARKPGQEKLLREKNVSPAADPKAELLDKAEKEIERLTTENQRLDQRMVSAQNEATKAWAEVERLRDKNDQSAALCRELEEEKNEYKRMYEQSYERDTAANAKISEHLQTINTLRESLTTSHQYSDEIQTECNRLKEQIASLMGEKEEWMADNLRLEEKVIELERQITQQNMEPDTEVQRLDSAIQDLTRARWILNRLSASGE